MEGNSHNKWVLIEVENQSIEEPDTYNSYEDAYAEMKKRYDNVVEDGDEAQLCSNYAFLQTDCCNIDWRIYEVAM